MGTYNLFAVLCYIYQILDKVNENKLLIYDEDSFPK